MTRIDMSETSMHCFRTDHNHARLINAAREAAHRKHGDNSIEGIPADSQAWLPILVEEVGEVAHAMTYDSGAGDVELARELVDVMAVASAWLDALVANGRIDLYTVGRGAWLAS
jgi:NTP pyrophosphatase (non-canonical NTP hydrolase)